MTKYKVYPKNYDPMIASGPPAQDFIDMKIIWTPADTRKMKRLEKQAKIQDFKPTNRVFEKIVDTKE
jgi:hypothetical protein